MDKHERVADMLAVALRDNVARPQKERNFLLRSDLMIVAAILKREYGSDRNSALGDAAIAAKGETPYDYSDYGDTSREWHRGYISGRADAQAAIRALKEAEHG